MKCRVYTDSWEKACDLSNYLWYHPALEDFIDRSDQLHRSKYCIYLTNGSIFAFGPRYTRIDLGVHCDKYAEYTDNCCPLDVLLMVLEEVVRC